MSLLLQKIYSNNWLAAISVAGCAFIGYAIYIDYKRTHSSNYKENIRANRKKKAAQQSKPNVPSRIPDPSNLEDMQHFFLQEVQLGEELMTEGLLSDGLDHLSNAIVLCAHPQQLLAIFNQTLPPEQFQMLIARIPEAKLRVAQMFGSQFTNANPINAANDLEGPSMVFMPANSAGDDRNLRFLDNDDLE